MQEISKVPVYTGTIPNKAAQSDNEFANNIFGFINYSGNVFVGNFNTIIGQFNVLKEEINTAAVEVSDNKDFVSNAKTYVAQTIALLPNGTINNITPGDDKTYSSNHINNLLLGSHENKFKIADGTEDNDAVNKKQLDGKAELSGSSTQKFKVAAGTTNDDTVNKGQLDIAIANATPTGSIIITPSITPLNGTLECSGVLLSRITFANLWAFAQSSGALVSDTEWSVSKHGCFSTGDGSTTFRIPDLRGDFIRGWDNGRGIDIGRVLGSLQQDSYENHSHTASSNSTGAHAHTIGSSSTNSNGGLMASSTSNSVGAVATSSSGAHSHTITVNSSITGSTETRPRNIALMHCIKY